MRDTLKPAIAAPAAPWLALGAGATLRQTIIIPGTKTENMIISNIFAFGSQIGRVGIVFTDKSYAYTHQPAPWQMFAQNFNPLVTTIVLASGSSVDVSFFNDSAAAGNFYFSMLGYIESINS